MSGMKKALFCLTFLCITHFEAPYAWSDSKNQNVLPGSNEFALQLYGYEANLFKENQSRFHWHLGNEARHVLVTAAMIKAGFVLYKMNAIGIPAYTLASAAGLAIDMSLSQDWKDFSLRQLVRAPLTAWRWYFHNGTYPWLDALLQESPQLLLGAWEIWIQSQRKLPEGSKQLHFEKGITSPQITFINDEQPHFKIEFAEYAPSECHKTYTANDNYKKLLHGMACEASRNHFQSMLILPLRHVAGSKLSVKVKLLKQSGQAESHVLPISPAKQFGEKHNTQNLWLTEVLAKSPDHLSVGTALSPLSEEVLSTLITLMKGIPSQKVTPLRTENLTVTVVNNHNMLVTALGMGAYLLADHTDTQGLSLPEFWMRTERLPSAPQATAALKKLEEQRLPGPEFGAWRLLSAVRAMAYQSLVQQAFSWISQITQPRRSFVKRNHIVVSPSDGQLTRDEADGLYQKLKQPSGKTVVVVGGEKEGKSYFANNLLGKNNFHVHSTLGEHSKEIEAFTVGQNNQVIEIGALENYSPQSELDLLKHRLIKNADEVIYVKGTGTRMGSNSTKTFQVLQKLFDSTDEAEKKITVVFNEIENTAQRPGVWSLEWFTNNWHEHLGLPEGKRYKTALLSTTGAHSPFIQQLKTELQK